MYYSFSWVFLVSQISLFTLELQKEYISKVSAPVYKICIFYLPRFSLKLFMLN